MLQCPKKSANAKLYSPPEKKIVPAKNIPHDARNSRRFWDAADKPIASIATA